MQIFEFLRRIFFYSGYLKSDGASFPKPLSPQKEREMVRRAAAGDEQARSCLIEHNLRLVAHIAKKYAATGDKNDDFVSIGTIGLIKGVNTFDAKKGTQLVTYIARCIENEILMFLRADKKTAAEVSLAEPIGQDKEGNQISLADIIPGGDRPVEELVETRLQIGRLRGQFARVLTKREKTVVELRYGLFGAKALPQREIAQLLGISRSYVSRIEKKALQKLRKMLMSEEE
ncbi:MAG: RNA polymerase sporulation sigma factor SigK [Christensenellaceae bacterium]|nr:RNA polymerase sporulation sigma factor SigK [Christensenellaceae bacterium]